MGYTNPYFKILTESGYFFFEYEDILDEWEGIWDQLIAEKWWNIS